jgi:hypothetical protein
VGVISSGVSAPADAGAPGSGVRDSGDVRVNQMHLYAQKILETFFLVEDFHAHSVLFFQDLSRSFGYLYRDDAVSSGSGVCGAAGARVSDCASANDDQP